MGSNQENCKGMSEEERLEKFCAYCRRVLRNANTDVLRAQARRARRVTLFCDLCETELNRLSCPFVVDEPEADFEVGGKRVVVLGTELHRRAALLLRRLEGPPHRTGAWLLALDGAV